MNVEEKSKRETVIKDGKDIIFIIIRNAKPKTIVVISDSIKEYITNNIILNGGVVQNAAKIIEMLMEN